METLVMVRKKAIDENKFKLQHLILKKAADFHNTKLLKKFYFLF